MGTYNNKYQVNGVDLIDVFYPVGTIYETKNASFDPNVSWGGVWTRITDKFLVAAGDTYSGTGGSASQSITLSSSNLPRHRHGFTPSGSVSSTFSGNSVTTSGGTAHSHNVNGFLHYLGTSGSYTIATPGNGSFKMNEPTKTSDSESSHTHTVTASGTVSSTFTGTADNTGYTGSGTAFTVSTVPPYQAVYIWERTS